MQKEQNNFLQLTIGEIRTPLTSLIGFLDLLSSKQGLNQTESTEFINICKQNSQELDTLTNNLLILSALDADQYPLNPEEINLNQNIISIKLD